MKIKVWCMLLADNLRVKGGKMETTTRLIDCRIGLFEKVSFAVPKDVIGIPFKKNRLAYLCDVKTMICVRFGGLDVDCPALLDIASKLKLYSRDKFWKFMGSKGMDLMEMLITMGAGYGFLRLLEFFIAQLHG